MKVLSLFDGISCGMVALERARIHVDKYVAYEIDEDAIKVSKSNYPQIEHKGDVFGVNVYEGGGLIHRRTFKNLKDAINFARDAESDGYTYEYVTLDKIGRVIDVIE